MRFEAGSSYDFNTGRIVSYAWDFGDRDTASGATIDHTFQPGSHTITLNVVDNLGATTSTVIAITVG